MQPVGPYRFIEAVSLCQVGSVWSAIDGQGNSYTVAVLDAAVAGDQRWRDAFVGTAHALAQPGSGGPRYVHAEFAATAPWVAYAAGDSGGGERLFAALGMECRPAQEGLGDGDPPTAKTAATPPVEAVANGSPIPDDERLATPTTRLGQDVPPPNPWQAGPPQPTPSTNATPTPTPTPTHQTSAPPHQTSAPPHQTSAQPDQTSTPPDQGSMSPHHSSAPPYQVSVPPDQSSAPPYQNSAPPYQTSAPPYQTSGPPYQTSGQPEPISGSPQPLPEMPRPYSAGPSTDDSSYDPLYSPVRHIVPSEPTPRRGRLWLLVGVAVVVLLVGVGTVYAIVTSGDDPAPPDATPTTSALPELPPATSPPLQPGLEPPAGGSWPAQWPTFTERDNVRTLSGLEGVGFQVKVPIDWECTLGGRAQGYVKYNCGVPAGQTPQAGGELIVRDCPQPCDDSQQIAMRQAEEAWGKRWTRSSQFATYAEATFVQDGAERHGLIVVAYFRGGSDGVINRQLVLRLTAPTSGANDLRRVATYLRETLIF
ncbi:hypothetical protein ACN28C_23845 [Plantactinospora sp. WMMC1484]|uniref:hypothetical protein n=1 Tax=Plantactinospora sp. WMMC1484 TaxID=3404122 RepID=UPI003BF59752